MKKAFLLKKNDTISDWLKTIFNITTVSQFEEADVVIFPGGIDVDPNLYNQPAGQRTSYNRNEDKRWVEYYKAAIKLNKKMFGIAKGAQFLTVMANASIYQHVDNHTLADEHDINIEGTIYSINSTHHQMMNPFVLEDTDYEILAFSETKLSNFYLNGYDDKLATPIKEPEVIFYKGNGALAIQFHPEFMAKDNPINSVIQEWLNKLFEYELKVRFDKYIKKIDPSTIRKKTSSNENDFSGNVTKEIFDEFVANYLK